MSNPISYFFVLSEYEKRFRQSWLKQAIPAKEYAVVGDLHVTFLRELYPSVYVYGPNGVHVDALIIRLTDMFMKWQLGDHLKENVLPFMRDVEVLFRGKFPLRNDVLHRLQQDSRVIEVYLYSPHAGDDKVNRAMRGLLDATAGLTRHPLLPAYLRQPLQQNLESLLSMAAAADIIDTHPGYHELYTRYLTLLRQWDLPLAQQFFTPRTERMQDSLSYITDH